MNLPGLPCNARFCTHALRSGFSLIYSNVNLESQGSLYYFTKTQIVGHISIWTHSVAVDYTPKNQDLDSDSVTGNQLV